MRIRSHMIALLACCIGLTGIVQAQSSDAAGSTSYYNSVGSSDGSSSQQPASVAQNSASGGSSSTSYYDSVGSTVDSGEAAATATTTGAEVRREQGNTRTQRGYVDLYEKLGFNTPCEGAVQPACEGRIRPVHTGTCYVYVCQGQRRPTFCPEQMACAPGSIRKDIESDDGCPRFECVKPECPIQNQPICKAGETLETYADKNGCKMVRCKAARICPEQMNCGPGTTRKDLPSTDGCPRFTCVKPECPIQNQPICKAGDTLETYADKNGCKMTRCKARICPEQMNCGPGTTRKDLPSTDGCPRFTCEKAKVCAVQANCAPGTTKKDLPSTDGCPRFTCEKAKVCAVQANCAPGTTKKSLPSTDGCPRFTCEKAKVCAVQANCAPGTTKRSLPSTDGCPRFTCDKVVEKEPYVRPRDRETEREYRERTSDNVGYKETVVEKDIYVRPRDRENVRDTAREYREPTSNVGYKDTVRPRDRAGTE